MLAPYDLAKDIEGLEMMSALKHTAAYHPTATPCEEAYEPIARFAARDRDELLMRVERAKAYLRSKTLSPPTAVMPRK